MNQAGWPYRRPSPLKGEKRMLVEYLRYHVSPDRRVEFEDAYGKAQAYLKSSPHCLGYELAQCVKEPHHYILRILWDSAAGHLQGFRTSAEFPGFLALVRPFLKDCQEMEHYEVTDILWQR
jgi:heme-degrading monooxygenase HmoA